MSPYVKICPDCQTRPRIRRRPLSLRRLVIAAAVLMFGGARAAAFHHMIDSGYAVVPFLPATGLLVAGLLLPHDGNLVSICRECGRRENVEVRSATGDRHVGPGAYIAAGLVLFVLLEAMLQFARYRLGS